MTISRAHNLRRIVRELLSITFWAHSLFIWNKGYLERYSNELNFSRYLLNLTLVGFIFFYSYFSKRGWFSVLWDLGYVYMYPFIVVRRMLWRFLRTSWRYFKENTVIPATGTKVISSIFTDKQDLAQPSGEKDQAVSVDPMTWKVAFRPFFKFTILWALLVHTTFYEPGLACIAAICVIGAARSLWYLHDLLSDTSDWTGKLRGSFATTMAAEIAKMTSWEAGMQTADVERSATNLRVWESTFGFISQNKAVLSRFTWAVAIAFSLPFYGYISVLFASTYYAIARAQHLQWHWSSALLDSLYMPFAFTDLPSSIPIRLIGGLQAIAVSIVGWNVFVRHFSLRFENIAKAAVELQESLATEELRDKVKLLEVELEKNKQVKETAAHSEPPR